MPQNKKSIIETINSIDKKTALEIILGLAESEELIPVFYPIGHSKNADQVNRKRRFR